MSAGGALALVTGASSGIGRATALALAEHGYQVVGTSRNATAAAEEPANAGLEFVECDLASDTGVERLLDGLGARADAVDVLVNNVGGPLVRVPFLDGDVAVWDEAYRLNLRHVVQLTHAVLRRSMRPRGRGSIVNVSSIAARTGTPNLGIHYAAYKAALNVFTLGLAREVGPLGIRVNAVAPGTIDTPLHRNSPPGHLARIAERIPLRRVGTATEIARLVCFLAGDEAGFVSGETIYATGGY